MAARPQSAGFTPVSDKESEHKVVLEYADSTADIAFVSNDGHLFKIHSYHLLSQSPVFRDMLSTRQNDNAPRKAIEVDTDNLTLHIFFDLMWKTPDNAESSDDVWIHLGVLQLAQRFECPNIEYRARRELERLADSAGWDTFCVASHIGQGDVDLAERALRGLQRNQISEYQFCVPSPSWNPLLTDSPVECFLPLDKASKCSLPFLIGFYRACNGKPFADLRWHEVADVFRPAG